jgi:two-component system, cell cycle sensor histidine kinase and response regulator CckA
VNTLEHSAELYRAIVETAGEGIWVVDENDRTTFVNPQLAKLLGYEPEEIVGQRPQSFVDDHWVEDAGAELGRLRRGIPVRAECPFRSKDGTLVETLLSCRPVHDADERYVGAVLLVTAITEQRNAQRALEVSELRFRNLIERLPVATYVSDRQRQPIYASPQIETLMGFTAEEFLDNPFIWKELLHGEDRERVLAAVAESARSVTAFCEVFRVLKKNGQTIHVQDETHPIHDANGQLVYWQGIVFDVTKRVEAEEALRRSEQFLRTMYDNEPECVKLVARDGALLEMNAAGLAMIEADSLAAVRGERIFQLIAPEHRAAFVALHERVCAGEHGTLEFELIGLKGTRRWMETTSAPLRDESGEIVAALSVTRDATARRGLEEQLRQGQKMEAIGRIAGGVAHDFNNLLTAIIGSSEAIAARGGEAAEEAAEILPAADHASELVCQLLAFSRQQILETKVLDLNEVVRETERILSRTIGDNIDLELKLSDELRPVWADAGQLQQVVLNLAVNARDAMPAGGMITLETQNVVFGDDAPIEAGTYVLLTVSDTGEGMTPEVREQIFDPFFTTKPAGQGTGLGLATVHGIVNQSGGHVTAYSRPDLGSIFKVYLPASNRELPKPEPAPSDAAATPATETVLLVEDQTVIRKLVREILERDGYTVLEAENPEQALTTAERPGDIHLLLTDVVMPRMSGPEIARALGGVRADLKVLYMSGHSDLAVVQRGLLEPGTAFIQKPFRARELTDKVRLLLERG